MTRSLRDQENQLDDFNTTIVQQETAYVNQLIDIFGRPYSGDIGPGKLYAQGYVGPDLNHWFIVDRPASLASAVDTSKTFTIETTEAADISTFTADKLQDILANRTTSLEATDVSVRVQPSQWVQYSDVWPGSGSLGTRAETGELQAALQDAQQTYLALSELNVRWATETAQLDHLSRVFADLLRTHRESNTELATRQAAILALEKLVRDREITADSFEAVAETALLGTAQGQTVFNRIVAARSLGDLTDGRPQSTTSTLGDSGLAGMMAQINADFSVAESRLGINNPDYYGTVFSLRGELFRLLDVPGDTSGDEAWRQTLERHMVANVLNDSDVATQCRNIQKPDGSPVPGIIIEFSTTIEHGKNFFGLPLAAYDHNYSASSYGTKISNAGIVFPGYVGMDGSITGLTDADGNPDPTAGDPANGLSGTPYVYLIPCGIDYMRAPLSGDTEIIRGWKVQDQALPLPYNLGANDFNSTQFFNANGTFSEEPWVIRRHQAFRAEGRDDLFHGAPPLEFSTTRLIARSAWNSRWKLIIPAYTLLNNEQEGLKRFAASVQDIKLYLRTYSHSGN